jgi:hypothetical protein
LTNDNYDVNSINQNKSNRNPNVDALYYKHDYEEINCGEHEEYDVSDEKLWGYFNKSDWRAFWIWIYVSSTSCQKDDDSTNEKGSSNQNANRLISV